MLSTDVDQMLLEVSLDKATEANYRRSVRFFGEWLGRTALREDLDETTVNRWLKSMESDKSKATIRGHKASITRLWNWLAESEKVPYYEVRRLRKIKVAPPVPSPWSLSQVHQLLAGADSMIGTLRNGLRAADLMRAWVHIGYETAFRPGDIRRLHRSHVVGGTVSIVQHKTGVPHVVGLSEDAVQSLEPLLLIDSEKLFPASRNTMRRWELRLYESAKKHGFRRLRGQGLGTLRKTNATEVCRRDGLEAAARSLGHVSGSTMAKRHYVAPDAIARPPHPPSLADGHERQSSARRTRESDTDHRRRAAS